MSEEELAYNLSVIPDGATSWIATIEIPVWRLTVSMYAFTAYSENEAVWAMHRFMRENFDSLRRIGPGHLNFTVPSRPHFEPLVP